MTTATQLQQKTLAQATATAHRAWWRGTFEVLAWLCIVVLAAECIFSASGIGESEYLQPDPVCGISAFPNKQVTWRKEGFSRVRFNSWGMQDAPRQLQKPPGVKRLVMAGDSFVEALQVDRANNMCSLLSAHLNGDSSHGRWEVLNWGVSSSNLGQIYLRLKRDVFKFSPDVVVVPVRADAVYELIPRNDGSFLSARPTFFIDSKGELAQDDQIMQLWQRSSAGRRMRALGWLRANSHIWGVMGTMAEELTGWFAKAKAGAGWGADVTTKQTAFAPASNPIAETEAKGVPLAKATKAVHAIAPEAPLRSTDGAMAASPLKVRTARSPAASLAGIDAAKEHNKEVATRYYWPVADKLLEAMRKECEAHGAKLIVVRLPACPTWRNDVETSLLQATCSHYGIAYCDTSDRFASEMQCNPQPMWFSTHFTARGHRVFADELYRYLDANQRVLFTGAVASN